MTFRDEEHFRSWLQEELARALPSPKYVVLESKNVTDVVVCKESSAGPIAFFIEVKYYQERSGRINLGTPGAKGFQPEILMKQPKYFEKYTRWLIASKEGKAVFVDNATVRRHASGGKIDTTKQNNIQISILGARNKPFAITKAPTVIIKWLESVG